MQLLLDRIKQGITSCKVRALAATPIELRSSRNCSRPQEAATFLKKRAALEDAAFLDAPGAAAQIDLNFIGEGQFPAVVSAG